MFIDVVCFGILEEVSCREMLLVLFRGGRNKHAAAETTILHSLMCSILRRLEQFLDLTNRWCHYHSMHVKIIKYACKVSPWSISLRIVCIIYMNVLHLKYIGTDKEFSQISPFCHSLCIPLCDVMHPRQHRITVTNWVLSPWCIVGWRPAVVMLCLMWWNRGRWESSFLSILFIPNGVNIQYIHGSLANLICSQCLYQYLFLVDYLCLQLCLESW